MSKRKTLGSRKGTVMVPVIVMIVFLSGLSVALLSTVHGEAQQARVHRDQTDARYVLEGAAQLLQRRLITAKVNHDDAYFNQKVLVPTTDRTVGMAQAFLEFGSRIANTEQIPEQYRQVLYVHGTPDEDDENPPRPVDGWLVAPRLVTPSTTYELMPEKELVDGEGVRTRVHPYILVLKGGTEGARASLYEIVEIATTPIFQYAIFYDPDLELLPGPNMTISGRIHCNNDIYVGVGNNRTLTIDTDYFRAAGRILRMRKNDGSLTQGSVQIKVSDELNFEEMWSQLQLLAQGIPSLSGLDSQFLGYDVNGDGDYEDAGEWFPFAAEAIRRWKGTVQTGEHGVGKVNVPPVGSIDRFVPTESGTGGDWDLDPVSGDYTPADPPGSGAYDKGFYHGKADLSVVATRDPASGTVDYELYDASGFEFNESLTYYVQTGTSASEVTYVQVSYTELLDRLFEEVQQSDKREFPDGSRKVPVTDIDIAYLNRILVDTGGGSYRSLLPPNGLLYGARKGASAGNPEGIRLRNGHRIEKGFAITGSQGISFDEDTGDLLLQTSVRNASRGSSGLTVVTEDPLYIKGDYNTIGKKAASVIADAVNLLSNGWNDALTTFQTAQETTYNVAMISGSYETTPGNYNGGFENLPRFHENWTGVNCNIRGSFVNLYESRIATGRWQIGNGFYWPPNRNWDYDPDFNDLENLPPWTPQVAEIRSNYWFKP